MADLKGGTLELRHDGTVRLRELDARWDKLDFTLGVTHGPVHDLILAAIGSVADLLRTLLDIPDDISEWLSDLFNVSFGVFNLILQFVADFFGKCVSFFQLDDPYPMFPETSDLAEVMTSQARLPITVARPGRDEPYSPARPTLVRAGDHGFDPAAAHILAGQSIVLLAETPARFLVEPAPPDG